MVRLLRPDDGSTHGDSSASRSAPPNYASRRVQYQLLALVFSLMVVLVLMQEVAKPKNWAWLWGGSQTGTATDRPDGATTHDTWESDTINTRLPETSSPAVAQPGTIVSEALLPVPDDSTRPTLGYLPGIDPERFHVIRDDTTFRRNEIAMWREMFDALANMDSTQLKSLQPEPVGFIQLYRQPDVYRGKLVEVQGTVHRAQYVPEQDEEESVSGYWQCWLRPAETDQLIVVYSLTMPEGFPEGFQINEPVRFVGLFFKRWAYLAQDGPRSTPLVLARQGVWTPAPVSKPSELPSWGEGLTAVVATGVLAIVVAWWAVRQTRRPLLQSAPRSSGTFDPAALHVDAERASQAERPSPSDLESNDRTSP